MDIKKISLQDLESFYNLASKLREGHIMMARANNNMNTRELSDINAQYNMIVKEVNFRLNSLYEGTACEKEVLNEEVSK